MPLNIGDKAPVFTSKDATGNVISLSDFLGKKIILYFYPKDDTTACTAQACNLRDNYAALIEQGYVVIGVSSNDEKSHKKFISKYQLPFILLADVDKSVHELYGTWQEKKMYGRTYMGTIRTTFIIDEQGLLVRVIDKIDTKNHAAQIISLFSN